MKVWKVNVRHGHFIDQETKERIYPVQGKELIIVAEADAFTDIDPTGEFKKPMSSEEKYHWAKNEKGAQNIVKIMNTGDELYFKVLIPKLVKGDESRSYTFSCRLLEDLYIYLMKGKDGNVKNSWNLVDCQCEIIQCIDGGLSLDGTTGSILIKQPFTKLVANYFRGQHSGASAAFYKFFISHSQGINASFRTGSRSREIKLDDLRIRVANNFKSTKDDK